MIASYGDSTDGLPKEYFFRPEGANRPYVEVPDFTEEEAEGAYRKHQRKFCLIPDHYAKLEEKMVRKRLREPLLLWLIANICRNGEIEVNQQLVGTDLSVIPEYTRTRLKTDDCVEDEYLDFKRFLEVTLPMKMIENGKCRNTVPSSDLQDEECQEKLQRLLRLGLLEHTTASGIGFRYERFYDYYFGLELRRKTAENTALECHPADDWRFYRNEHRK